MPRYSRYSRLTRVVPRQLAYTALALGAVVSVVGAKGQEGQHLTLDPAIVFSSSRDNPYGVGPGSIPEQIFAATEIYLWATPDGAEAPQDRRLIRLTNNQTGDGFAVLDPTGRKVVFDGLRARTLGEPLQVSDLFVMNVDDYDDVLPGIPDEKHAHLTRGSSAGWSADGRFIAFHASDSGVYTVENLARPDPGTPMLDSDIFVLNVDDCIKYRDECLSKEKTGEPGVLPEFMKNITKAYGPTEMIDEDPDWSPDGRSIVFTRFLGEFADHHNIHSEIVLFDVASGALEQLTNNALEERAPEWSPDGKRILFMCRGDNTPGTVVQFQLCVIEQNAQGLWVETQLTFAGQHLSARWSADGKYIIFHRAVPNPDPLARAPFFQLFRLTFSQLADGTYVASNLRQLTTPPGFNGFPAWGPVRVRAGR